ncbi:hypothetical protein S40285_07523 [Stachybotrys chlorohalonatus IBT 40285]|uniref:Velvet domain-containing protein n=1 Tax=Stachybotrys chlorohalonatus (strain IBT 40285) TaxID=1283841 RepID=A0A084QH44_STAC4|nr:hypothetical protein S40285_07523 [Stachybotrys chlorohalonata IBT 40285]
MSPPRNHWAPDHTGRGAHHKSYGNVHQDFRGHPSRLPPMVANTVNNGSATDTRHRETHRQNMIRSPAAIPPLAPPRYVPAEPRSLVPHRPSLVMEQSSADISSIIDGRAEHIPEGEMSYTAQYQSASRPATNSPGRLTRDAPHISAGPYAPIVNAPPPLSRPPPQPHWETEPRASLTPSITERALSEVGSPASENRPSVKRVRTMQIPNLIGDARAGALRDLTFKLELRQQPQAARSCGFGDKDRRVIDPPPIVELVITSSTMTDDEIRKYRRFESYVMSCSIWDKTGAIDASYMPEEFRNQRRLMGSLIGTPFVGKDEFGREGCFFTFSDLSCRTPGSFRLKFSVMMIDPRQAGAVKHFPILAETKSDVLHVFSAKDFPGMLPSSELAHRLKAQGCIIQLKKGNDRAIRGSRISGDVSEDDDNDDDDDDDNGRSRRKRRSIRC